MAEKKREKNLEIDEDMSFQEKEWIFERTGWVIGLVILIAAVTGLFGHGPISKKTDQQQGLTVQYDRFARYQSPTYLSVELQPSQIEDGKIGIWIERNLLVRYQLERVVPQPESTQLMPDRVVFEFKARQTDRPLKVTFYLQPNQIGSAQGQVGEQGTGQGVTMNTFVFP